MLAWLTPPIYPGSQRAGEDPLGEPQVSPGSNRQADRQKVGEEPLRVFLAWFFSIPILQGHLQGTRALRDDQRCGQLGRNRTITLIIRAFDPRKVRALEKGLLNAAVLW